MREEKPEVKELNETELEIFNGGGETGLSAVGNEFVGGPGSNKARGKA